MTTRFEAPLTAWYAASARDLPWRRPGVGAWPILVSEFMLQQTPVSRVLARLRGLARQVADRRGAGGGDARRTRSGSGTGSAIRAARCGCTPAPRSSPHGTAVEVPASISELRALPGVGSYTAAAVASFAFGQRHAVLDTNVRRVLARLVTGQDLSPRSSASVAETKLAESLLPPADDEPRGDLVGGRDGTRRPGLHGGAARRASRCPLAADCAWRLNGSPAAQARRPAQRYEGTDRQCRGAVLAVLRNAPGPVPVTSLDACWPDAGQLARCSRP